MSHLATAVHKNTTWDFNFCIKKKSKTILNWVPNSFHEFRDFKKPSYSALKTYFSLNSYPKMYILNTITKLSIKFCFQTWTLWKFFSNNSIKWCLSTNISPCAGSPISFHVTKEFPTGLHPIFQKDGLKISNLFLLLYFHYLWPTYTTYRSDFYFFLTIIALELHLNSTSVVKDSPKS